MDTVLSVLCMSGKAVLSIGTCPNLTSKASLGVSTKSTENVTQIQTVDDLQWL